jgi:hypothetical protein
VVYRIELSEQELKLIVAALRQARHTFEVARRQEEKLASEYRPVEEAYDELDHKLSRLLSPGEAGPQRVK